MGLLPKGWQDTAYKRRVSKALHWHGLAWLRGPKGRLRICALCLLVVSLAWRSAELAGDTQEASEQAFAKDTRLEGAGPTTGRRANRFDPPPSRKRFPKSGMPIPAPYAATGVVHMPFPKPVDKLELWCAQVPHLLQGALTYRERVRWFKSLLRNVENVAPDALARRLRARLRGNMQPRDWLQRVSSAR